MHKTKKKLTVGKKKTSKFPVIEFDGVHVETSIKDSGQP